MDYQNNERGLGVVAVIVIIAVLGIGSYAAVSYTNNAKVEVDSEEMMDTVQEQTATVSASAMADLQALRTSIATGAAFNLDAAMQTLQRIKVDLNAAYATADMMAKAEIESLITQIDTVEAKLEAETQDAATAFAELAADIEAMAEETSAEMESDINAETSSDSEASATMSDEGASAESDVSVDAEASVDADTSTMDDMIDTAADANADIEATSGLIAN